MATRTSFTAEQFAALEEPAGLRYELSDGELIVTPSSSFSHNDIRDQLTAEFRAFLRASATGKVISETDVRLTSNTVRRPDVCFFCSRTLEGVDLERSPLPVSPDLVVEIVSKNDQADDLLLKVSQYIQAGAHAVWLMYPNTRLAYRYTPGKLEPEVRTVKDGGKFEEPELLPGFSLPLAAILK